MAEFHYGDPVCVLMAGRHIGFTITKIHQTEPGAKRWYEDGQGTLWPEERLDYDFSTEQRAWWMKAERRIDALNQGVIDVSGILTEARELGFPPSRLSWLEKNLREAARDIMTNT